jgi:pathogenesis-related protein 1
VHINIFCIEFVKKITPARYHTMKPVIYAVVLALCQVSVVHSAQPAPETERGSVVSIQFGDAICKVSEAEKDMYYKCQVLDSDIQPYSSVATCGMSTTIPAEKQGSCGLADAQEVLDIHNEIRSRWGAAPLLWSRVLTESAQSVADRCAFEPSGSKYGENMVLSSGTTCAKAAGIWTGGEDLYSRLSENSPDFYPDTGAFTQMVWKSTLQVGCAKSSCPDGDLIVCHYHTPGNVVGAQNFATQVGKSGDPSPCEAMDMQAQAMAQDGDVLLDKDVAESRETCCRKILGIITRCEAC